MLGSARAEALSYSAVKLFSKYSNLCDHGTWTSDRRRDSETDERTTCVASRGNTPHALFIVSVLLWKLTVSSTEFLVHISSDRMCRYCLRTYRWALPFIQTPHCAILLLDRILPHADANSMTPTEHTANHTSYRPLVKAYSRGLQSTCLYIDMLQR